MIDFIIAHRDQVPLKPLCAALGAPRATVCRALKGSVARALVQPRRRHHRALTYEEQQRVLEILYSERFRDRAPGEIYATLLDEGKYVCSDRTMYRLLAANQQVRERRAHRVLPEYHKPELVAPAPNRVWSWDITKLRGPKGVYYHLYVILDIFSRYVVSWMVAERESADLATRLIHQACTQQEIPYSQLTLHADRGPAMASWKVAQLLAALGVYKTHSRPRTSNDNPYSESQFKTLKYHPEFPDRFETYEDAKAFCKRFFEWYNHDHRHSGVAYLTPNDVHTGRARVVLGQRQAVLEAAHRRTPERFAVRRDLLLTEPGTAWINPPEKAADSH